MGLLWLEVKVDLYLICISLQMVQASWTLLENEDGESLDFLGASFGNQGNYDNTVLAPPI